MKGNKKNDFTPKITIFCCENSAYRAADMAGTLGLIIPEKLYHYPVQVDWKKFMF